MKNDKQLGIAKYRYVSIKDVPWLTLEWAKESSDGNITINEINTVINTYEEWLDEHMKESQSS